MRHLLLCLALALPAAPALAGTGDHEAGWSDGHVALPPYRLHRNYLDVGDGLYVPRVFSRDDGYFQGRGGGVAVADGRARFDYDRDYPYDLPRAWSRAEQGMTEEMWLADEPECRLVRVPDRRSGSAEVRVCS